MSYETILLEVQGRVGLITLTRPEALNALNAQLVSEVNLYKALGGGWNAQTAQNEPVSKEAPKLKMF